MQMLQWSFMLVSILFLLITGVPCSYIGSSLSDDQCSILSSGGAANPRSVRSFYLSCEQGSVHWERPYGSMLLSFEPPYEQFSSNRSARPQLKLCIRMAHSDLIKVQKIVNSTLMEVLNGAGGEDDEALHCFEISPLDSVQLFLRANFSDSSWQQLRELGSEKTTFVLYYSFEEILEETVCGECNERQFIDAFCSANLVFKGKLIGQLPRINAIKYSVEFPLLRRPLFLNNILYPATKSFAAGVEQFNTAIFSKCPPEGVRKSPVFGSNFLIVANAQIGFAQLLCAMKLDVFEQMAASKSKEAPCDLHI